MNVRLSSLVRQQGVAIAMVAWFLAAMSLLVVGIVSEAQNDVRMAQLHSSKARAIAAGDGAIQLMLANSLTQQGRGGSPVQVSSQEFVIGNLHR